MYSLIYTHSKLQRVRKRPSTVISWHKFSFSLHSTPSHLEITTAHLSRQSHVRVPSSLTLATPCLQIAMRCVVNKPYVIKSTSSPLTFLGNSCFRQGKVTPGGCPIFVGIVCYPCEPGPINVDDKNSAVRLIWMGKSYGLSWHSCPVGCKNDLLPVGAEMRVHCKPPYSCVQEHVQAGSIGMDEIQAVWSLACNVVFDLTLAESLLRWQIIWKMNYERTLNMYSKFRKIDSNPIFTYLTACV